MSKVQGLDHDIYCMIYTDDTHSMYKPTNVNIQIARYKNNM